MRENPFVKMLANLESARELSNIELVNVCGGEDGGDGGGGSDGSSGDSGGTCASSEACNCTTNSDGTMTCTCSTCTMSCDQNGECTMTCSPPAGTSF